MVHEAMIVLQEAQAQGGNSLHHESSFQQVPVAAAVEDNLGLRGLQKVPKQKPVFWLRPVRSMADRFHTVLHDQVS